MAGINSAITYLVARKRTVVDEGVFFALVGVGKSQSCVNVIPPKIVSELIGTLPPDTQKRHIYRSDLHVQQRNTPLGLFFTGNFASTILRE